MRRRHGLGAIPTRRAAPVAAGLAGGLVALSVGLAVVATLIGGQAPEPCTTAAGVPASAGRESVPANLLPLYLGAARRYRLGSDGWAWLASINAQETDYGRNLAVSSAGAVGWMQFMPSTWRQYGLDASGDGIADPSNPSDAIYSAARYLRASGAPGDWHRAVFAYNHAEWYFQAVAARARSIATAGPFGAGAPLTGNAGISAPAGCGADAAITGGQGYAAIVAAADQLGALHIRYVYGGGHITPARPNPGLDCSSSVSWVLQHAGYRLPTLVSSQFMTWGLPRPGTVSIYANPGHVFMHINGRGYFGTSGFGHPAAGTGPAWFTASPSPAYLATFTVRHVPDLP